MGHSAKGEQRVRSFDGGYLEVYKRPHDPDYPLVCVDESSKQLIKETRTPIPMKPGQPARYDYEYERNGTANLFMMFAPLEGWRHVKVTGGGRLCTCSQRIVGCPSPRRQENPVGPG
jgi:hypothetical protein